MSRALNETAIEPILAEIQHFTSHFSSCTSIFVKRAANFSTHLGAKEGSLSKTSFVWVVTTPSITCCLQHKSDCPSTWGLYQI
jgi:hypothetical protein